jgi:hypothetical protein
MARILAFNGNVEALERLEHVFLQAGHEITAKLLAPDASVHDMVDVVREHDPHVIVYDVPPPFGASVRAWQELATQPGVRNVPFVLTTTSSSLPVGRHEPARVVVLREPLVFDEVVSAVEGTRREMGAAP